MEVKKINELKMQLSVNGKISSTIITNLLLFKNLKKHYKIVRDFEEKRLITNIPSAYEYMEKTLIAHPEIKDKVAISQNRNITYRELQEEYNALSKYLYNIAKVNEKEKVSVCASGSIEGIVAFFAMNKIGAINARIFNGSKEDKMLKNLISFNSKVIITDSENIDTILNIADRTILETVIITSEISEKKLNDIKIKNKNLKFVLYTEALEIGNKQEKDYVSSQSGEDLASILYTSGSSGEPKPISIPNRCYTNMVDVVCSTTGIKKCDKEKSISVVSHEYPYAAINCTIMILLMGKTLILPKKTSNNQIDFNQLLAENPDKIQAIPNFYKLLDSAIKNGDLSIEDLNFLDTVVSGGEKYLNSDKKKLLELLIKLNSKAMLIDGFGFGELASATALKFGLNEYFLLMNGVEAKAVNPETLEELPSGQEGLLCLTSPTISDGYYNNEESTKKSYIRDDNQKLWFVSDTYGSVHGYKNRLIKLGGRVREYFITGDGQGSFVKVYAGNVEDVISSCDVIKDCIVVPSDTGATPSPVAYVSLRTNCNMTNDEIEKIVVEKCKSLEVFARPTSVIIEDEIGRTPAGKKDYTLYKKKALN